MSRAEELKAKIAAKKTARAVVPFERNSLAPHSATPTSKPSTEVGAMRTYSVEELQQWREQHRAEQREVIPATIQARPIAPPEIAPSEPILAIPQTTRRYIVFGALGIIGAVALAVTIVSLNDMAEGFQAALNLATWKAWILALLADILFIGVEMLCIFAPKEIVAHGVTLGIRGGAIGISMASNAFSLSYIAPIPLVGVAAGIIMPLAIAGCTYTIGYAVHNGGR
jgi:hypothetical protein